MILIHLSYAYFPFKPMPRVRLRCNKWLRMSNAVLKDTEQHISVPQEWRSTFTAIVQAFVEGNYKLINVDDSIQHLGAADAQYIRDYLHGQKCRLISLPESTWEHSVYQWYQGFWDVWLNLYTVEEGRSDLFLLTRVYEVKNSFKFSVQLIFIR